LRTLLEEGKHVDDHHTQYHHGLLTFFVSPLEIQSKSAFICN
jgi:hypothetical protein